MSTPDATLGARLPHSALTPVFTGLRIGLHTLIVALTLFVIVRASFGVWPLPGVIVALAGLFLGVYAAGGVLARTHSQRWITPVWLTALMILWLALTVLAPDASYIVFPLFFLQLHVLRLRYAIPAVLVSVILAVWALSYHLGWSLGAVLGPLIGAGVAVAIGLGYRALLAEANERQRLIADLLATRAELAATSRQAGTIAERERLAREIHDTVAQGLSSIQLLIHAAERTVTDAAARAHLELARQTAATNLHETRRFIRELTPPALETQSLPGALARLVETATAAAAPSAEKTAVSLHITGDPLPLPMRLEATLLRIAQGSLANVSQHAHATRAEITLSYMPDEIALDVVDNGQGFDVAALTDVGRPDSFGLMAIRQRVEQQGGSFVLESQPAHGTALAVTFPLDEDEIIEPREVGPEAVDAAADADASDADASADTEWEAQE
ncbi:sensor histidine kinase [Glaciibacter psychrotolerans]|uniref:Signal transduction histidine kinase n=1 Tax=Glaciibacter psychrotolerans TaxID=670054 RepID=A0A7Z0EBZ2_9MICO|nr:sensor histidine kinase [Leifsonia psychrotolerans]NYJ18858.1 signal transduction histidine kinase [Leifsonia psychrotolerans]